MSAASRHKELARQLAGWDRVVIVPDRNPKPGLLVSSADFRAAWLPIVGPSGVAVTQMLHELRCEGHEDVPAEDLARMLGLGSSPFVSKRLGNGLIRADTYGVLRILPAFRGVMVPDTTALPSALQRSTYWPPTTVRLLRATSDALDAIGELR